MEYEKEVLTKKGIIELVSQIILLTKNQKQKREILRLLLQLEKK